MIFVTVGAQMPFDRLVQAVDEWAGRSGTHNVFAQIGNTHLRPRHIEWAPFLQPAEFLARVREARLIIAHAGMGSILTALEHGKPILVMPRRGDLGETRNDHQVDTGKQLGQMGLVHVARDESELIERLRVQAALGPLTTISPYASPQLLQAIRGFIEGSDVLADEFVRFSKPVAVGVDS